MADERDTQEPAEDQEMAEEGRAEEPQDETEVQAEGAEAQDDENATQDDEGADDEGADDEGAAQDDEESTEDKDDFDFTYEVEDLGPCYKKFSVLIPKGDAHTSFEKTFATFMTEAMVPGFRKGRAPRWLLERKFGKQIKADIAGELMQSGLRKVIAKADLKPIGVPERDDKAVEFDPEKDFEFEFKIYVRPEFEIENYFGIELEIPDLEATDEAVENTVKRMLSSEVKLVDAPEEAVAEEEDLAVCDASIEREGQTIWQQEGLNLVLTERTRSQSMLPQLVDVALGGKAGDEKAETITLPETYQDEEHRGQEATLKLKITELKKPSVPEFTDEMAVGLGFADMASLRDRVREDMERTHERVTEMLVEGRIREKLVELADFELPDTLVERHIVGQVKKRRAELEAKGTAESEIVKELAAYKDSSTDELVREMKLIFVMQYICEKEGVELDEGDVDDRIARIAGESKRDPFDVRDEYEASGQLDMLRDQITQEKTFELLKKHAVIRKVDEEEGEDEGDGEGRSTEPAGDESAATAPETDEPEPGS